MLGVGLLGFGLVVGRADVALLGVPAVLGPVLARARTPRTDLTVQVSSRPSEGSERRANLHLDAGGKRVAAHVRVAAPGHEPVERVVLVDGERDLTATARSVRTGPQDTFRVDHVGRSILGDVVGVPAVSHAPRRVVLPGTSRLGALPTPARLLGLTGPHTSRRPGDGDELRDVHELGPGDSLRRIDWRATARRSPTFETLYVRRTWATAEATVVVVIDSRDEVGPDVSTWNGGTLRVDEATSLDLARNAAATVARATVDRGDRVALEDLGRARRPLPAAGGRRHLRRVLHGLALSHPVGEPAPRARAPRIPGNAIVYLFSTFLDDAAARTAEDWRHEGHTVVAVDVLPEVTGWSSTSALELAWRITRAERAVRLDALRAHGVHVVRWLDEPTAALAALARTTSRSHRSRA
ncbi:hypothetical protein Slu03_15010 [Sediminihabitans luteus]|nr:hypothetical protein Slu03_15010 [Sediminihabitans luteus]